MFIYPVNGYEKNLQGGADGFGICQRGENARTEHCSISNNRNTGGYHCKGAVVMYGGVLSECVITNNSLVAVTQDGGRTTGITLYKGLVYNCLVALNQAASGGVYAKNGTLVNCTIVSNYVAGTEGVTRAGGIVFIGSDSGAKIAVTNCVISGNWNTEATGTPTCAMNAAKDPATVVTLSHTLLDNWAEIDPDAEGCLAVDPLFTDFDGLDWRLGKGSPCRDAGITLDFMRDGYDLDGRPRVVHRDRIDLGCYEADYISPGMMLIIR